MSVAGHPACTSAFSCAQRLREGGFPLPSSPDLHLRQMSRQGRPRHPNHLLQPQGRSQPAEACPVLFPGQGAVGLRGAWGEDSLGLGFYFSIFPPRDFKAEAPICVSSLDGRSSLPSVTGGVPGCRVLRVSGLACTRQASC